MASNIPSLNPVSCRSGSSFTSFSSARTLTTNRPASRRMSEISFVIRKKKKRYERKASACGITEAMAKVEESYSYLTECSICDIRKINKGTSGSAVDVCMCARLVWFLCCCARTTTTNHTRGLAGELRCGVWQRTGP